jgi:hypothetical protein
MRRLQKGAKSSRRHPGCVGNCLEIRRDNDTSLRRLLGGHRMARRTHLASVHMPASEFSKVSWAFAAWIDAAKMAARMTTRTIFLLLAGGLRWINV